jgi:ribulose-phosphate 3-epimerase
VPSAFAKIADVRQFLHEHGCTVPIEVDGNVSFENIPAMIEAGADILVAGTSSLFHPGGTLAANVARTNEAVAQGLRRRAAQNVEATTV